MFGVAIVEPYDTYIPYDVYIVPGLVGMVLLFNGMQSSLAMVYDREMGLMRLLLTAPLPRPWLLFSKLCATALLSVLQALASWNPVSTVVAATRTLFGNPTALPSDAAWPLQHPVLCSFMWCVALIAVAAPLAVRRYRSRTTG